jgi:Protein kinase domain
MARLEQGNRIADRFLLQERIGDGGHGEVWAAWDESRQLRVALKFLHAESCGLNEAWTVLSHEAQMVQRLDHPGVLATRNPKRDGQLVFLPMEFAAGGDIKSLRGESYLRTLPVLLRVAEVLAHAHSRGVIHRDIKPGNVLLDAAGVVRLADFGTSARTGSDHTLAAGSPFTASPQQLRGEPATAADDIYGLGALAYELLGGYPPFYPDFDADRVQTQMPQKLKPKQPAPPRLLALVESMLAREPAGRPQDIAQVIATLEQCLLDTKVITPSGGAVIEEAGAPARPKQQTAKSPRLVFPAPVWLAAAAVMVGGVLFLIGRYAPDTRVAEKRTAANSSSAVTPNQASPDREATRAPGVAIAQRALVQEIAAGQAALMTWKAAQARGAFERARRIAPEDPAVKAGMSAVEKLEQLLALHSTAVQAEASGDQQLAHQRYTEVLRLDPAFAPASEGLKRTDAALLEAKTSLELQQTRELNAGDERRGRELEQAERWLDAVGLYESVLARDASLSFAQSGLTRSSARAAIVRQLDEFLARPERLTAEAVRHNAQQLLDRSRDVPRPAPVLDSRIASLEKLLKRMDTEVRVEITSDNYTRISIARVGDLGSFVTRELTLRPGRYTLIGTRDGFRDVRREISIEPGQGDLSLSLQCIERI